MRVEASRTNARLCSVASGEESISYERAVKVDGAGQCEERRTTVWLEKVFHSSSILHGSDEEY